MNSITETTALTYDFGVEVHGVDLNTEIPADTAHEIRDLMSRHHLLVFRGNEIGLEGQLKLVGQFGQLSDFHHDGSYHSYVSSPREGSLTDPEGELLWHSDTTYSPYPDQYLSLYGDDVTGNPVGTRFVSGRRAHDALSPSQLARIEGLKTIDLRWFQPENKDQPTVGRTVLPELPEDPYLAPRYEHPVVVNRGTTGNQILMVSEFLSWRLVGLSFEDSEALYAELFEVLYDPEHTYEHDWRQNDLLVWDNIALQHSRRASTPSDLDTRSLRRVVANDQWRELFEFSPYRRPRSKAG